MQRLVTTVYNNLPPKSKKIKNRNYLACNCTAVCNNLPPKSKKIKNRNYLACHCTASIFHTFLKFESGSISLFFDFLSGFQERSII